MLREGGLDLDAAGLLGSADPRGMGALIEALPAHVAEAWRAGLAWPLPDALRRPRRVLVAGVGGSAIGADVVAALAFAGSTLPVQVVRGYQAPPLDAETLLVGASFSGNTPETCAALEGTLAGPGMRLVITTGGRLATLAEARGWPAFRYAFAGPPRAALAWGVFPLLAILSRLGALAFELASVDGLVADLARSGGGWRANVGADANLAKQIARVVAGRATLVIGAGVLEVAARRWAGQLNENAKQWALGAALPEADHNLIVPLVEGWHPPAEEQPFVVLLDAPALDPRTSVHVTLTAEALDEAGVAHAVVRVDSPTLLGAVLEGCQLGDWVSLYAAVLNGVEPMGVAALDRFKARIAVRAQALEPRRP